MWEIAIRFEAIWTRIKDIGVDGTVLLPSSYLVSAGIAVHTLHDALVLARSVLNTTGGVAHTARTRAEEGTVMKDIRSPKFFELRTDESNYPVCIQNIQTMKQRTDSFNVCQLFLKL